MSPPKLPKKISVHISTSFSKKSFSRTYRRSAIMALLIGLGVVLLGILGIFGYGLTVTGQVVQLESLKERNARLKIENDSLKMLAREVEAAEKELYKIKLMLGMEVSPQDTIDFGDLVFNYKPIIPQEVSDSLDTLPEDSTLIEEEIEDFYPQVLPTVGFRVSRVFSKNHPGVDFAAPEGRPCFATADGIVSEVGQDSTYGNYLKIRHGKYYVTFYGHLQSVAVKKGQKVKMNEIVGFVGNTGNSSAPHLHFEVRHKGTPIDPANLFVLNREYKGGAYD